VKKNTRLVESIFSKFERWRWTRQRREGTWIYQCGKDAGSVRSDPNSRWI